MARWKARGVISSSNTSSVYSSRTGCLDVAFLFFFLPSLAVVGSCSCKLLPDSWGSVVRSGLVLMLPEVFRECEGIQGD